VRYTVLVEDVVVGTVELPPRRIAAGRLTPHAGYGRFAARVRAASRVLLAHGVYGPALSAHRDAGLRRDRLALAAAASLRVELALEGTDERPATVFVNLVESPADGGVVVIALFDDAPAMIAALAALVRRRGADEAPEA